MYNGNHLNLTLNLIARIINKFFYFPSKRALHTLRRALGFKLCEFCLYHHIIYNVVRTSFGLYPSFSKAAMICSLCSVPKHSRVMRSSTAALRFVLTNWLCSSLMTLPCCSAIRPDTLHSSPGLSGSSTDTVKIRSLKISP